MRLILSSSDFLVSGISYEGIPILINNQGNVVEPALDFFISNILRNARSSDKKTWESYGKHLYDYFGFLEARSLDWQYIPAEDSGEIPPLSHYVNWCQKIGNMASYVNDKTGIIKRFYRWAYERKLIDALPFYSTGNTYWGEQTNVDLKEPKSLIHVLTRSQANTILNAPINPTHHTALNLFLSAGLRAEEVTTLPLSYVKNLANHPRGKPYNLPLSPRDMALKNNKARTVSIPYSCMDSLWRYAAVIRPTLEQRSNKKNEALFLTRYGLPFEADGFNTPCSRLSKKLGFHIHPHLLRHTFASHLYVALEDLNRKGKLRESPILILQKQLGHSSMLTTMDYLHLIETINDEHGTKYQRELDVIANLYGQK